MERLKKRNSGYVLALVLTSILVILILGSSMLTIGYYGRKQAINAGMDITARCAADAGIERATNEINAQIAAGTWDDDNLPSGAENVSGCDASFTYTVTKDASEYTIQSVGNCGIITKTINTTLKTTGLFDFAVFARESILMHNSSLVDGINLAPETIIKIGTQSIASGKIDLKNNAQVNGDILVGVGGNPNNVITDHGAIITGNKYAMTEEQTLPDVVVPAAIQALPSSSTITGNTTLTTDTKCDSINLGNGKKITIDGDVTLYVEGDLTLKNNASIELVSVITNPDVNLTLYIGGDFDGHNGSDINNLAQDATRLSLYGLPTCTDMTFKNGSDFYGVIYAPNADIVLHNSANIYGSITGNSIDQKNSTAFYYDGALQQYNMDDFGVQLIVNRWQEQ